MTCHSAVSLDATTASLDRNIRTLAKILRMADNLPILKTKWLWSQFFIGHCCVYVPADTGPTCLPHTDSVCRTKGTVGMDWIFIDTSRTDRVQLRKGMEGVINHTASGQYSQVCAAILNEYICVSNYPSCDLSYSEPRPIMVRTRPHPPKK